MRGLSVQWNPGCWNIETFHPTCVIYAAPLKAQPDADETLNMILARLGDMKAEETVTIDLRGKSAFSDYMIVTTGRANRHVGAIAENLAKGLKETGIKSIHIEGLPTCDWVLT